MLSCAGPRDHLVQFYEDDQALSDRVGYYLQEGLDRAEAVVAIATPVHQDAFVQALACRGVDVERLIRQGQVVFLDAARTLSRILKDGEPDQGRFREVVGSIVEATRSRSPFNGLRAYGEMVDLLWTDGRRPAAHRLEELWNDFLENEDIPLLCAYRLDVLGQESRDWQDHGILAAHSHWVPSGEPGTLERALWRALDEILGTERIAALRPLILASQPPRAHLRPEEAVLLWIGRNLGTCAEQILERTRVHLSDNRRFED